MLLLLLASTSACGPDADAASAALAAKSTPELLLPATTCGQEVDEDFLHKCLEAAGVPACSDEGPVCCALELSTEDGKTYTQTCSSDPGAVARDGIPLEPIASVAPELAARVRERGFVQLDEKEDAAVSSELARITRDQLEVIESLGDELGESARVDGKACGSGCHAFGTICEIFEPQNYHYCESLEFDCYWLCTNAILIDHGIPPIPL